MDMTEKTAAALAAASLLCAGAPLEADARASTRYKLECFAPDGALRWVEEFDNLVVTAGLNKLLDATLKTGLTSPTWYVGLVGATQTDGAITSGAATFTSAAGAFAAGDVGKKILVRGAGAAGADLQTTISAFTSSTQVTLAANAGTTVSGAGYLVEARAADTMASHAPWTEATPYSNANRPTFTPGTIAAGSVDNSASPAAFTINATATLYGAFMADNNTKGGATGTLYGMGVFSASRQVFSGDTLNVTVTPSIAAA